MKTIDPLLSSPSRPTPQPRRRAGSLRRGQRRLAIVLGVSVSAAAAALGATLVTGEDRGDATVASLASTTASASPSTTVASSPTGATTTTVPAIDAVGSLWWLVNGERPMPADYVPVDLVTPDVPLKPGTGATQLTASTAGAFESLVADAATAGFPLQLNSGYRSYEQQQTLYDRFVEDFGADVAAERVAFPGTSEHQTGLAADVGLVGLPDDQVFGDTEASAWVAANAHRFGFILRYPPDKSEVTGYTNEPWHLRYVGVELATELHATGLTMEEHFGLVPTTSVA